MQRLVSLMSNTSKNKTKVIPRKLIPRRSVNKKEQRELLFANVIMHQVTTNEKISRIGLEKSKNIYADITETLSKSIDACQPEVRSLMLTEGKLLT